MKKNIWKETFLNHPLSISEDQFKKLINPGWFAKKSVWFSCISGLIISKNLKAYKYSNLSNDAIIVLKSGAVLTPLSITFYDFKNISVRLDRIDMLKLNPENDINKIPFTDNISSEDREFVINHIQTINKFHKNNVDLFQSDNFVNRGAESRQYEDKISTTNRTSIENINNSSKIVIDGSNLCYKNGTNFIGLSALQKITHHLLQSYTVIVIFDNQILNLLSTTQGKKIRQKDLGEILGENCEVHIVQSRRKADDTIVSFIRHDNNSFVLSNDRFKIYRTEKDEFEDRLITFEILGNQAIIHDLNVNVKF